MKFNTLSTQAVTILLLSICISVTTSSRKCTATLNSAAYANSWEKPNVKWKSPKHASDGVIDATIHGRIEVPTDLGGTTKAHVCYAQIRVNLTDCTFVRGANATSWDPHTSPIYTNPQTWQYNDTISFRPDCPESIFVEVYQNH